jgi:hypothetical protein
MQSPGWNSCGPSGKSSCRRSTACPKPYAIATPTAATSLPAPPQRATSKQSPSTGVTRGQVRFAYAATTALRYGVGYLARFVSTFRDYPAERMAQALGRHISGPDFADSYALKTRFLLSLADEARGLRWRIDP